MNFNTLIWKEPWLAPIALNITAVIKTNEINTAGITKIGYPHPHKEALKLYKELGGEIITVGSDAHMKENIGYGFDVAEDLLKQTGFRYYTVFKNRKPEFIPL